MADNAVINQPNPQPCLIFLERLEGGNNFNLIVDDDTFPQNRRHLNPPPPFQDLTNIKMLGDHNGYQLFFGDVLRNQTKRAVIWKIPMEHQHDVVVHWDIPITEHQHNVVGLSFRPDTPVPTLVKLCVFQNENENENGWRVRVSESTFGVNENENQPEDWAVVGDFNFPPFGVDHAKNCINGVIYFRARDPISLENFFITFHLDEGILRNDVRPWVQNPNRFSSLKVNGSLRLLVYQDDTACDVFAKGNDNEFNYLYTVFPVDRVNAGDILAFRNNGQAVLERIGDHQVSNIAVYDADLDQFTTIIIDDDQINGMANRFSATPYIGNAN